MPVRGWPPRRRCRRCLAVVGRGAVRDGEAAQVGVSGAVVDGEVVAALGGDVDPVAGGGDALGVGGDVAAGARGVELGAGGSGGGLGAVDPDADVLLAEVELAGGVVGVAALDGGARVPQAHGGRGHRVAADRELPLLDAPGGGVGEGVQLPGGRGGVEADAVGGDLGGHVLQPLELPGRGVDAVDVHRAVAAGGLVVGGDDDVAAQVDVVAVVAADPLDPGTGHVVDLQRALLVGAHDDGLGWVRGVDPDRRVVGGVAAVRDGGGLHRRGDGEGGRLRGRGRDGQGGQDGGGEHCSTGGDGEGHRIPFRLGTDRGRLGRPGEPGVNGT